MATRHETARLLLRPWRLEDVDAFHRIWGDPTVIWWGPAKDRAASTKILRKIIEQNAAYPEGLGWFALVDRASGNVCGNVFLQPYPYGEGLELGFHVARRAQGCGLATEAARALIDAAFLAGEMRIVVLVTSENAASQRVCRKLGLRKTGTQLHAGQLHDVLEAKPET